MGLKKSKTKKSKKSKKSVASRVVETASSLGGMIGGAKSRGTGKRRGSKMTPERLAKKILVERLKKKLYKLKYGGR